MTSPDLYLIAHKVRGSPAFDIATRLTIGDEEGWIIPTSGHRAYPYWTCALDSIEFEGNGHYHLSEELTKMPPDLDDHYPTKASPEAPKPTASGLLAALGLGKPKVAITRRV